MKLRPIFYVLSTGLVLSSIFGMIKFGFKYSLDFAGGTEWEIQAKTLGDEGVKNVLNIYDQEAKIELDNGDIKIKMRYISEIEKGAIYDEFLKADPEAKEMKFTAVGPKIGKELVQKTIVGIALSVGMLLWFISRRFQSLNYGLAAILAMLHDSLILLGSYSYLGHFFGAEIDALFVTAVLTTLSSSVHDTVVTFDRIREIRNREFKLGIIETTNIALNETIVRSINNSVTIILMLSALVLIGGSGTFWFSVALLIGTILGTYSSFGVAAPLLVVMNRKK